MCTEVTNSPWHSHTHIQYYTHCDRYWLISSLECVVSNMWRCRRSLMAVHFDEVWDDEGCNQMCDTCRHVKGVCVCVWIDSQVCSLLKSHQSYSLSNLHSSRSHLCGHYPACQAGGADSGASSLHGWEADSSEAGGGLDGERPRQAQEDNWGHHAVSVAGWSGDRAAAAAGIPQVTSNELIG